MKQEDTEVCLFVFLSLSFTDPVSLRTVSILTGKLNKHSSVVIGGELL